MSTRVSLALMRAIPDQSGSQGINKIALPLGIVALIVGVWLATQISSPWLAVLASLNPVVCAVGAIRSITRGLRPVSLVFYIFTFGWLGVAPVVQISMGKVAWGDTSALYDPRLVGTALVMNLLGSLAFLAGVEYAGYRGTMATSRRSVPLPAAEIRPWVIAGIVILSVALMPSAIQANGGLASLFTTRNELKDLRAGLGLSMEDVGGPAYAIMRLLPASLAIAGTLLVIYAIQSRPWITFMRIQGSHLVALLVLGVSLVLFCNPLAHSRFTTAAALGSIAVAWLRPRSKTWAVVFAAIMFTVTLLIYPLANAFRARDFDVKTGSEAFTSPDFDGFQMVINTLNYVADSGYTWGIQVLSGIGSFIPRSIWHSKADPASYSVAANAGHSFTNLSLPIHAEFYLEFGWIGVVVGMGALGFMAGRLDYAWLMNPGTKLALIAPYAAFAMLGVVRGPIGGATPIWGAVVVLLILGIRQSKALPVFRTYSAAENYSDSNNRRTG